MKNGWMIRAGNSGRYFDDFEGSKCVGIGWNDLGDLRQYTTAEALREAYIHHFGNAKPGRTANAVAMIRELRDDIQLKDKIQSLDPEEMEELTAALLRAMGYQTRVSARGPDRGVDVLASPDGLGLTQPRIKAEVKHRNGSMGSNPIRSFIGALRAGDHGLFVSTGGFTKEARYEAERATIPVTLIDIDLLADLVVANYERFDIEGQRLMPLMKVYWPAE